jgi:RNA polymerase sigma-70 factor, ECF subfamily
MAFCLRAQTSTRATPTASPVWDHEGERSSGTRKGSGLNDNVERGKAAAELDPDVQLMLRVREDDAMAFQQLVQTYQLRLLRVLKHMVGSTSTAEDLVQDVFLRVWRARHNYTATAKFSTWLFHIAHNVASNAIRDRQRKREVQVSGNSDQQDGAFSLEQMAVASTGMIPIRKMDKSERADMVRTAVEALNERQRTALLLCKFEGLSYQEIADTMDLSVQAVKSLLSRARVNLKILLEPYLDEGRIPGSEAGPTND